MILTAHQPVFLPYLGTFGKIAQADLFCLFDNVQYGQKSYENRTTIKTHSGPLVLTVPVKSKDHFNTLGKDVEICNQAPWRRKHLKSIELAYKKAPYFDYYYPLLTQIECWNTNNLCSLNLNLLYSAIEYLGLKTPIVRASDYPFQGEKSALVLDMCKQLGATKYIFGQNGEGYCDRKAFEDAGIEVEFQHYVCKPYPQLYGEFLPYCSIIDLLFNAGPDARNYL